MFVDCLPVAYLIVLKRGGVGTQGYGAQGQGVLPADQDRTTLGIVNRSHTYSFMVSDQMHITFGVRRDSEIHTSWTLIWQNIFSVPIQVPKIQTRYQVLYLYTWTVINTCKNRNTHSQQWIRAGSYVNWIYTCDQSLFFSTWALDPGVY